MSKTAILASLLTSLIFTTPGIIRAEEPVDAGRLPAQLLVHPGSMELSRELSVKMSAMPLTLLGTEAPVTKPTAGPTAAPPLTSDSLRTMLDNLGYDVTEQAAAPAQGKRYLVKMKRGDWDVTILLGFGPQDKTLVSIMMLSNTIDPTKVQSQRSMELLATNGDMAPFSFALLRAQKQLILYRAEHNSDITPALLRDWLDKMLDVLIATYPRWKDIESPAETTPAVPSPGK